MRTLMNSTIIGLLLLTTHNYAGGKMVAPVETEAIPVSGDISSWYLGLGTVAAKFHGCGNGCNYEDLTYGTMLRGGYDFNEYIGIEARGIRTFLDKGPFGGVPLQHIGLYVKPQYSISERFNIYGLAGYGYTENLGNGARLNYFDNDHGLSAGLGLEYDLSFAAHEEQGKGWSLFADSQRLLIKSDVPDMDIISIGAKYNF